MKQKKKLKDKWPKPWGTEPACGDAANIYDRDHYYVLMAIDPDLANQIVAAVNSAASELPYLCEHGVQFGDRCVKCGRVQKAMIPLDYLVLSG